MFSLLTVILAFTMGMAIGATIVWAAIGKRGSALVTLGGSAFGILVLIFRFVSEWR